MRTLSIPLLLAAALLMTGCSIKQTITPAVLSADMTPEICMIPAAGLRAGFNTTYESILKNKGFQTRQLAPDSNPSACALSTTYIGTWSWDLALYMSYADIRVYQNGQQVGQAEYDSRWGGGRLDKFISAETKIAELTHQLFPNGAAGLTGATARTDNSLQSREAYRQARLDQLSRQGLPYDEYQQRYREIMAD